ncbi:MAG: dinitrogenase iron-molybdenum cofactor biosynthesis protein [Firmicutes bacterium]|nr:dinitrogenase iron-molybdenum cofactor biosynthesis protein [Bacillota bacterium]
MKVVVTAQTNSLDSEIDPRFGRCQYLIFVDTETDSWVAVPNPALAEPGGAGIAVSQFVADEKADALITGNIGPNAARGLAAQGIKVYVGSHGTVKEALAALKAGQLTPASGPTVKRRSGM